MRNKIAENRSLCLSLSLAKRFCEFRWFWLVLIVVLIFPGNSREFPGIPGNEQIFSRFPGMKNTPGNIISSSQIFFNLAGKVLNISFQPTNSIELPGRRKGSYVALVLSGSSLDANNYLHFRQKIYREWSDKVVFFYIKKNIRYGAEKTWIILLEPLDKYIWMCLLTTIGAISIYYRSLHAGFEVVKCSLLQSIVRKKSIIWASLVFITVISYEYQAIVTRDMIAKPPLTRVTDINVLLRMGYRYFTDSGISIATLFPAVAEALEIKEWTLSNSDYFSATLKQ